MAAKARFLGTDLRTMLDIGSEKDVSAPTSVVEKLSSPEILSSAALVSLVASYEELF